MINFFKNIGPIKLEEILTQIKFQNKHEFSDINIYDIKDLVNASNKHITFLHSKKYELAASTTKAAFCITKNLSNKLPDSCKPIEVDNVLVSSAMITTMFYPDAITDDFDAYTSSIEKTSYNNSVNHGQNILIGKNVVIGSNCSIGHNTIIESNVVIGDNCSIGSNVIIRNTIIHNNVSILDGCVIGKKDLVFFQARMETYVTLMLALL